MAAGASAAESCVEIPVGIDASASSLTTRPVFSPKAIRRESIGISVGINERKDVEVEGLQKGRDGAV